MQTNLQFWKIYLDTCCLSRFFDDQTQARVYQETEVIGRIISQVHSGHLYWISSDVLVDEVEQNSDLDQRLQIKDLITNAHQTVSVGTIEILRGKQLETLGFKELDALHLACAESGLADIFLTTDDRLLRGVKRYNSQLSVRVENPYAWFQEIAENERIRNDR
ncbi:PIN domain-containing protein [Candidatus Poribacteria bacterium]|nr:PIN domain-containing protein [Candidatus Poribacteria bacterium]